MRSELFKLRSTRTTFSLALWMAALVTFLVLLHTFSLDVSDRDTQMRILGWGTGVSSLFAGLLGALSFTGEVRHGTIRPTFLATPDRARVIAYKAGASALAALALGALAEALTVALETAGLAARGAHDHLHPTDFAQLIAGGALAAALWAAIGVGLGALVRRQVATIVALAAWLLLIETALIGSVPATGRFAPGAAAGALAGAIQTQTADQLLAPLAGALLLAAYAGVIVAAGMVATVRRDVA